MKATLAGAPLAAAIVIGYAGSAWTRTDPSLPVPSVGAARDIPNAHELPDPKTTHKVVSSVATAAKKPEDVNPTPEAMVRCRTSRSTCGR
jgi:hypothetical protein